jgi:hypothetical protein
MSTYCYIPSLSINKLLFEIYPSLVELYQHRSNPSTIGHLLNFFKFSTFDPLMLKILKFLGYHDKHLDLQPDLPLYFILLSFLLTFQPCILRLLLFVRIFLFIYLLLVLLTFSKFYFQHFL